MAKWKIVLSQELSFPNHQSTGVRDAEDASVSPAGALCLFNKVGGLIEAYEASAWRYVHKEEDDPEDTENIEKCVAAPASGDTEP